MRLKKKSIKKKVNKILKKKFGEFKYFGGSDVANKLLGLKSQISQKGYQKCSRLKKKSAFQSHF